LSDEENIKRIRDQGIFSNDPQTIRVAFDALEPYEKRVVEDCSAFHGQIEPTES
jgi:hypothetical protein